MDEVQAVRARLGAAVGHDEVCSRSLSHGRHVTGPTTTRRSLAGRPQGTFGSLAVAAPGEVVQVDSTPLAVHAVPGAAVAAAG